MVSAFSGAPTTPPRVKNPAHCLARAPVSIHLSFQAFFSSWHITSSAIWTVRGRRVPSRISLPRASLEFLFIDHRSWRKPLTSPCWGCRGSLLAHALSRPSATCFGRPSKRRKHERSIDEAEVIRRPLYSIVTSNICASTAVFVFKSNRAPPPRPFRRIAPPLGMSQLLRRAKVEL